MVGRSLSEDERSAELLAVVRGLQAFYSSHARKAVFPDLSDKLVYGDYNVAGARGHQLLETVTAEINACAHIKSGLGYPGSRPLCGERTLTTAQKLSERTNRARIISICPLHNIVGV